ncbi:unnamed protein product [Ectocarpus sp. 12 AP-2014]
MRSVSTFVPIHLVCEQIRFSAVIFRCGGLLAVRLSQHFDCCVVLGGINTIKERLPFRNITAAVEGDRLKSLQRKGRKTAEYWASLVYFNLHTTRFLSDASRCQPHQHLVCCCCGGGGGHRRNSRCTVT